MMEICRIRIRHIKIGGTGTVVLAGAFGFVCRPHLLGGTAYTTGHIATELVSVTTHSHIWTEQ